VKIGVESEIDTLPPPSDRRAILLEKALKARRGEVAVQFSRFHLYSSRPELDEIALVLGKPRKTISVAPEISWSQSTLSMELFLLAAATDRSLFASPGRSSVDSGFATIRRNEALLAIDKILLRYSCPLNIVQASEGSFFEECLRYLMVIDRVQPVGRPEERLRWLLLTLVALRCRTIRDIRALDVLNYFWEQLPRPLPDSTVVWSFFGNYDAALERNS
jgi:hypothetical protein